jgi:hypothetical protein
LFHHAMWICCNAVPRRQHLLQFSMAGQSKRKDHGPCCCSVNMQHSEYGRWRWADSTNIDFFNALHKQPTVHKTLYNLQGPV